MKSFVVAIAAVLFLPWDGGGGGPLLVQAESIPEVLENESDLSRTFEFIDSNVAVSASFDSFNAGSFFAPTNEAWDQLSAEEIECMLDMGSGTIPLTSLMLYHYSVTAYTASDAANDITMQSLYTLGEDQGEHVITSSSIGRIVDWDGGNVFFVDQLYLPPNFATLLDSCNKPSSQPSSQPSVSLNPTIWEVNFENEDLDGSKNPSNEPSSSNKPSLSSKPSSIHSNEPSTSPSIDLSAVPSTLPSTSFMPSSSINPSNEPSSSNRPSLSSEPTGV